MDDKKFRRSNRIEDRRKEKIIPGVFGDADPDVYGPTADWSGISKPWWGADEPPVQRTRAGKALGLDELERAALDQEQNNQVRDALDNASVAIPGQDDPNGPPVRINNRGTAAPVPLMSAQDPKAAIVQAAKEAGVDPAYALAIAERESNFNPQAKSSKTIRGLYQMRGDLRAKYGVGDSDDAGDQARGWMRSLPDIRRDMKSVLGRDPTDQEAYLGHHYGAKRAARTLTMDPSTPVDAIFTPQEMAANPHFARAATIGNLNGSVMGDVDKRMARFGGANAPRPAELATPAPASAPQLADLSSFGEPVDDGAGAEAPRVRVAGDGPVSMRVPRKNLLEQARDQYPVLKKYDYGYTEKFRPGGGYLEHWEPGEPGAPATPEAPLEGLRPKELPLDKHGLEIRDPTTPPSYIAGDIVSHHLRKVDPVVKKAYDDLQNSFTPDQQSRLQGQYQYAQEHDGEKGSFEDWKERSGMPAYFRGYTFQQWPKEFNDKAYTPEQRQSLDGVVNYLKGGAKADSPDLSSFGEPVEQPTTQSPPSFGGASVSPPVAPSAPDLSSFGEAVQ